MSVPPCTSGLAITPVVDPLLDHLQELALPGRGSQLPYYDSKAKQTRAARCALVLQGLALIIADLAGLVKHPDSIIYGSYYATSLLTRES